jgi:hypothetical protein
MARSASRNSLGLIARALRCRTGGDVVIPFQERAQISVFVAVVTIKVGLSFVDLFNSSTHSIRVALDAGDCNSLAVIHRSSLGRVPLYRCITVFVLVWYYEILRRLVFSPPATLSIMVPN